MNGKAVITKLKAAGWTLRRISGSHHIMASGSKIVPVPVHGSRDLTPGMLSAIERQTGIRLR
ncbi:MAG: type II toxin-antitoxin system HicA family toxin [Betaproteobacteria bacterium]|nr:type II toxin-antitoxin system HicA family toxin [Betaproteobacteria bacterium]